MQQTVRFLKDLEVLYNIASEVDRRTLWSLRQVLSFEQNDLMVALDLFDLLPGAILACPGI